MQKLPVLMYHNLCEDESLSKGLTISSAKFESHLHYLQLKGYETLHFEDLNNLKKLPPKAVIITFDDVYETQWLLAYPLLEKYAAKASFFIPFKYVGNVDAWNTSKEKIMTIEQLQRLDKNRIELGLHSYRHGNYNEMDMDNIQKDIELCKSFIAENNLEVKPVLAYPYGKYPKKGAKRLAFFDLLKANAINYGLRIGNRVNKFPFKNKYEIQRLDIKGEDDLKVFQRKLKRGKRLF